MEENTRSWLRFYVGGATFLLDVSRVMKPLDSWRLLKFFLFAKGLALGGEYGGATTYVAEHAPGTKRILDFLVQTTATVGLFISLW
jgi:hypothetical protein